MSAVSAMAASTAVANVSEGSSKRRVRLISAVQLGKHNTEKSLWVAYKNRVYDVTEFAPDHPGGDELILQYAGKDMGNVMEDPVEHSHSESAFELLEEHFIGRLAQTAEEEAACATAEGQKGGNPAYILPGNEGIVIDADYKPEDTDVKSDFKKYGFLDLNKPLILQMWRCKFSKEFYLRQVHSPRHLREPARLFGPWYLEMFTRTPWYVVPIIWLPISIALFCRSAYQFSQLGEQMLAAAPEMSSFTANATRHLENLATESFHPFANLEHLQKAATASTSALMKITTISATMTFMCFLLGIFVWTVLEYTMHRFLFHLDDYLPDRPIFLTLHFLLHGIHHFLPMDRLRLVMPPILFFALSYPFTRLAHIVFPTAAMANGVISGAFAMYVCYDCMHYALHHTKLPDYIRQMKSHHMTHHWADPDKYFGVTSRFWDKVFGTL